MDLDDKKFKYEQICFWYSNALYEIKVLNTPEQHWKPCLDCGVGVLETIINKDCFVDVKDLATPNIQGNYNQIKGYTIEGCIKSRLNGD